MSKTLEELKKGLNGELNMSQGMEEVQEVSVYFFLFTIYSLGLLFFSLFRILDGTIIFDETDTIDLSVLLLASKGTDD